MRIDIRSSSAIKDGDDVYGRHTKVKVVKNKVAPPFKRAEFDIMFGEGISRSSEIVDLGVEYDIIQKSGSWFSYNGTKIAQGRDAAKRVIQDNPELADELEALIMEALDAGSPKKKGKSKGKDKKDDNSASSTKTDDVETGSDDLDDIDFDDDMDDDFSIEEDV